MQSLLIHLDPNFNYTPLQEALRRRRPRIESKTLLATGTPVEFQYRLRQEPSVDLFFLAGTQNEVAAYSKIVLRERQTRSIPLVVLITDEADASFLETVRESTMTLVVESFTNADIEPVVQSIEGNWYGIFKAQGGKLEKRKR